MYLCYPAISLSSYMGKKYIKIQSDIFYIFSGLCIYAALLSALKFAMITKRGVNTVYTSIVIVNSEILSG